MLCGLLKQDVNPVAGPLGMCMVLGGAAAEGATPGSWLGTFRRGTLAGAAGGPETGAGRGRAGTGVLPGVAEAVCGTTALRALLRVTPGAILIRRPVTVTVTITDAATVEQAV